MRKVLCTLGVVGMAVVLATSASAGSRGIEFTPLGFLPDLPPEVIPYSWGSSMTDDGMIVAGSPSPFGGCMLWTESNGWELIANDNSSSCYISGNGATVASRHYDDLGFENSSRWLGGMDWELLTPQDGAAPCDFFLTGTFGVSGDGSTIGGLTWSGCSWARGYTWTESEGMVPKLGILEDSSRVNALNTDGSIAVGWNRIPWGGWQATKWVNGVPEWIADPGENFDNFVGEAWDVNSDGSVVVGSGCQGTGFSPEGWISMDGADPVCTGAMPWGWFTDQGLNFAASEDGTVVGGRFGFGPFSVATMWTPHTGLVDLNQFMINQGRTEIFDGWSLVQINDISPDGTKLLGCGGNPDQFFGCNEAFILDISKMAVCHAPPGNPENARTINISMDSIGDHMAHGDFLGTCEAAGGGFVRAQNPHELHGLSEDQFFNQVGSHTPGHSAAMPSNPADFRRVMSLSNDASDTPVRQAPTSNRRTRQR